MAKVSIREFSRMVGCSDTAVRKAIASGKIVHSIDYSNPIRPKIDSDMAVMEWKRNQDPDFIQKEVEIIKPPKEEKPKPQPKVNVRKTRTVEKKEKPIPAPKQKAVVDKTKEVVSKPAPVINTPPPVVNTLPPISTDVNSIAEIKRQTAKVKLADAALDLKKKQGSLVEKDKVYKALFKAGQEVSSALQAIPDRVIDDILAQKTRNEAHNVLSNAIKDELERIVEVVNRDIKF